MDVWYSCHIMPMYYDIFLKITPDLKQERGFCYQNIVRRVPFPCRLSVEGIQSLLDGNGIPGR